MSPAALCVRIVVVVVLVTPYHCLAASNESGAGSGLYRSRRLTSVVQDVVATKIKTSKRNPSHLTCWMQTEAQRTVNALIVFPTWHDADVELRFQVAHLSGARKFLLRQGLWIGDLQIPPGQECSNGSMILLAVVLWRASFR